MKLFYNILFLKDFSQPLEITILTRSSHLFAKSGMSGRGKKNANAKYFFFPALTVSASWIGLFVGPC